MSRTYLRRTLTLVIALAAVAAAACTDGGGDYADAPAAPDGGDDGGAGVVPETVLTVTPLELSNESPARFEFTSAPPMLGFRCRVDGAAAAPCTSPLELSVTDGEHTFEVAAVGADDVPDPTPATFTWTVDLTPPDTTIVSGPPALDNSVTVSFELAASEDAGFTCALDGGAAVECTSPHEVTGLTDGAHTLVVTATDLAGNVDPTPATHAWTIDTTAPDTTIDSGPTGAVSAAVATFTFSTPDAGAGATFDCALDGAAFAACTSPVTYSGLAEGAHTFEVRVRDATGNVDPTPATRTWTVDTIAPTVMITGGPTGPTADTTPEFTFTTGGSPTTVQCRVDAGAFAACTSPHTTATLADGAHTFEVQVTDAAGNQATATRSFTIDTTGPTVMITGGPTGATNDATPTFTFTTGGSPTTVECRVGAGSFAACTSPHTTATLADGDHAFEVRVTDAAGNQASATRSFTIDTTGPTVMITGGPTGATNDATPTFTFTTGGSPTTVQCRVDAGAFAACTSPHTTATLADGDHTFEVQVTDAAGNQATATRSFTVDTTGPTVMITGGPTGATNDATPTFTFTTGGSPATVQCRVDAGAFAACTSPHTTATLADGDHTFEVRVTDAAGNQATATRSFTVDTAAPTVMITGGPTGATNDATPTFTFTTGGSPTTVQCRVDAGSFAACTSPHTTATLADGDHTFEVRVTDAAGNQASATRSFTVDTTAPTVMITGGPTGATNDATPTFTFTTGGSPTTVQCRVDAGAFAACTSPHTTATLADGDHTFEVRVTDAAGNQASATRSFTVDTTAPTVMITGGPTGATNDATPTFTFTTGGSPTTVQCRVDAGAFAACTSPHTTATLADGDHTFEVRVTDAAGNQASATRSFTVDTAAPTVMITGGPTGATNVTTPTFTFTTGGSPTTTQCRVDTGAFAACSSPHTTAALANGAHTFEVQVADAAGNTASATRMFTVDTVAPTVMITGGPTGATNDSTPTFTFTTGGSPTTTQCRIDAATPVSCTSSYTPAALSNGAHTFYVTVTDAAGNTATASRSFTVDTVAPTVMITGGPTGATNDSTPTFTFTTGGSPTTTQCRIDAATPVSCTSSYTPAALSNGAHTFYVTVTDAAGNTATASRSFTVDTVAPTVSVTGGPANGSVIYNASSVSYPFTSSGASGTRCRLYITGQTVPSYASCTSPATYSIGFYSYTFQVQAFDAAGNTATVTRTFQNQYFGAH